MMDNLEITRSDFLISLEQETNFLNLEVTEAASWEELNYVWGTLPLAVMTKALGSGI